MPGGRVQLVVLDFAMTTIAAGRSSALLAPGGAATRYEAKKRSKYQAAADEINAQLVPLIVDDAGAWGESALPFWRRVAARYAQRFDLSVPKAITSVMSMVSSTLMAAIARTLRRSLTQRPGYLP